MSTALCTGTGVIGDQWWAVAVAEPSKIRGDHAVPGVAKCEDLVTRQASARSGNPCSRSATSRVPRLRPLPGASGAEIQSSGNQRAGIRASCVYGLSLAVDLYVPQGSGRAGTGDGRDVCELTRLHCFTVEGVLHAVSRESHLIRIPAPQYALGDGEWPRSGRPRRLRYRSRNRWGRFS